MEQMVHTDIACTENHYHRNRRSIDAKSQIISSIPEFQAKSKPIKLALIGFDSMKSCKPSKIKKLRKLLTGIGPVTSALPMRRSTY